jgi:thiol-disulfide isomerase/thioredoxin
MENTIRSMKSIHGKVVNTMIEVQASHESNKLEVLSDLQIASNKMAKIITDAVHKYDTLVELNERAEMEEKSNNETPKKLNMKAPSLIYFYAEWCGYCKQFLPTWEELENDNKRDDINIVKFSCVTHKNKCDKINIIQGYPTIVLYKPDDNSLTKFEGERSRDALKSFVKSNTNILIA